MRWIMPLALAALLAVSGCVSVDSHRPPQQAQWVPAEARSPSPLAAPPTEPTAREELASTDPTTPVVVPSGRARTTPPRPAVQRRPPRARLQQPAPRPKATTVRKKKPSAPRQPAAVPTAPYDMKRICAAADSVVSPSIAQLCRSAYAR